MNQKTDSTAIDSIIDYIKERIESPFLMSFLVSWAVINRDFFFYLFLGDDKYKYQKLSNWDFSSSVFGLYSPFGDSFFWPLIFSVLIALLFTPISLILSGIRYSIIRLKFVGVFAKSQKNEVDLSFDKNKVIGEVKRAKAELKKITSDIEKSQNEFSRVNTNLFAVKDSEVKVLKGQIYEFLISSLKFKQDRDRLGEVNFDILDSSYLTPQSIVKIEQIDKSNKVVRTYNGCTFDFLFGCDFFDLDHVDDLVQINSVLRNLSLNTYFSCKIKIGEVTFRLLEAKEYKFKAPNTTNAKGGSSNSPT